MKKILIILFILTTFLSLHSCSDPYEGTTFQAYDVNPASAYMSSREDLSEWVHVLKYSNLYNAINQATAAFTVFAPTNEAMQRFYQKKGISSIEDLGVDYARTLVKYHVIEDSIDYATFIVGGELPDKTISGDQLTVTFGDSGNSGSGLNAVYLNDTARVKEMAIPVSNGFVYTLDDALIPITESIYGRITDQTHKNKYKIFNEALAATGWSDSLNIIKDSTISGSGIITERNRAYTLLAVTDAVFAKAGINSLDDLKQKLKVSDANYTDTLNSLNRYIAYHILKGSYSTEKLSLSKTDTIGSYLTRSTLAKGTVIKFSKEADEQTYLNYDDITNKAVFSIDETIIAKNGQIHNLTSWLPIFEPAPAITYFDFCDYPEVGSYITSKGTEGQIYQTANPTTEYRTNISSLSSVYDLMVTSPASTSSYNTLDYFTVKENKSNWIKCLNKDQLIINIGYMGSVAMKTPTIIKGKYKVTLGFCYATSMNFMRTTTGGSNGGKMQFTIDGKNMTECTPYTTVQSNTLDCYSYVLYDTITFDETTDHNLKIVVMDPSASTNSSFRIQLDYLLFEPLD